MADKIKKFFQKKKTDAKFKLAGPGHKLSDSAASFERPEPRTHHRPRPRNDLSEEARQAAAAALARLDNKQTDRAFNTSFAAIQAQVKRELEAEKRAAAEEAAKESPKMERKVVQTELEASPVLAVNGVFFRCPMIGNEVLSKDEWKRRIKEFLYSELEEERGLTACLMIYSLNGNREKISTCVETLCKYLENIIANPNEDKYQRIRLSNRVFSEKVAPMEGAQELLQAAGFSQETIKADGSEEEYLVFNVERLDSITDLQVLCDALRTADPIPLELDRNMQVLSPSQAAKRNELPPVFYTMTPEDIKKEHQLRAEAIEKSMVLRTKAMREKDEIREMRKYRFALIRVRFPDGIFLQGTFAVFEKLPSVFDFVRDNLEYEDMPFILTNATGQRLSEENDSDKSLIDLRLVPASILNFAWDPVVYDELGGSKSTYLKPEVMMLVKAM